MTPIQRLTYEIVNEIVDIKRGEVAPAYAMLEEIHNSFHVEILEALRELYRRGLIVHRHTVNGADMFGVKESNHEEN